ncbi:MAG: gluconate 2-dehydrogenase subunit 3 family protein [Gemmatimonadota bacterium]|jgi:hypothetical protein
MSLPAAVATWASACTTRDEGAPFRVLGLSDAADLEAIASCILPSGDSPGAVEAGVIHFIDAALAGPASESLESVRQGLEDLRARVRGEHGDVTFPALGEDAQIAMLRDLEGSEFFGTVRHLTLAGMFSHPSYGGNRGEAGWTLIGFDAQGPTRPPFGHYDADYMERGA